MLINLCFGLSIVSSSATVLCIKGISVWINPLGVFTSRVMLCSKILFIHTPLLESLLIFPHFGRPSFFRLMNRLHMTMFVNMIYLTCPLTPLCEAMMLHLCKSLWRHMLPLHSCLPQQPTWRLLLSQQHPQQPMSWVLLPRQSPWCLLLPWQLAVSQRLLALLRKCLTLPSSPSRLLLIALLL
jgi:hypothetical protein